MPERRVDWDSRQVEALTAMWAKGDSCSQIAKVVGQGCTRSAVGGKARRLKLPAREERVGARARNWGGPRVPKPKPPPPAPVPVLVEQPPMVLETGEFVTVETISDRMCRWPIGHPGDADFHFCGCAPKGKSPYCEFHCREAYQPHQDNRPKPGQQQARRYPTRPAQVALWE